MLETLTPAERLAFVLHDVFGVPFADIAAALDRSEAAAQQLASRARRRLRNSPEPDRDLTRQSRVADGELDLRIGVAQHHLHAPRRVRVLEHVGQRLLGHPVNARLQLCRQLARPTLDLELDWQARAGQPADQGPQIAALLARPQHAEQAAHLAECVPAGLGDPRQRPARRVGIPRRGVAPAVGLGDHHRQRMRDHVMQLARDPRALPRRPDLRLLIALDLQRRQSGMAADPPLGEQRRQQHVSGDDRGPQ